MCVKFLLVNLTESSYINGLCVDEGRKKYVGMAELDLSCSEEGQVLGMFWVGHLLQKDSAACSWLIIGMF